MSIPNTIKVSYVVGVHPEGLESADPREQWTVTEETLDEIENRLSVNPNAVEYLRREGGVLTWQQDFMDVLVVCAAWPVDVTLAAAPFVAELHRKFPTVQQLA